LEACEDWKVVRWCRTQASSRNLQGIIDGGVDEAGMSTATSEARSALQFNAPGQRWLFAEFLV